jgi:hypothetical protein
MPDNSTHMRAGQRLGTGRITTPRKRSRIGTSGRLRPSHSKPGTWAVVQVWNGAVLATFDDEAQARAAISSADDEEIVILHVET